MLIKQSDGFTLGYPLFGAVKSIKNADCDNYKYSELGIRFDSRGSFSLSNGNGFGKNLIIIGVDMSLSVLYDNKEKVSWDSR